MKLHIILVAFFLVKTISAADRSELNLKIDSLEKLPATVELKLAFEDVSKLADLQNDFQAEYRANYWLASFEFNHGNYDKALDQYLYLAKKSEDIGTRYQYGMSFYGLATVYCGIGEDAKAVPYFDKVIEIGEELKMEKVIMQAKGGKGLALMYLGRVEESLELLQEQYDFALKTGDRALQASSLFNVSNIQENLNLHQKALTTLEKFEKTYLAKNDTLQVAYSLDLHSEILVGLGRYDEALHYLGRAMQYAEQEEINSMFVPFLKRYSEIYEKQGKIDEAFSYYKRAAAVDSAITQELNQSRIMELELQYETHVKDVALLEADKRISELKINRQRLQLFLGASFCGLIFAVMSFLWIRSGQIKKREMRKIEQDLIVSQLKTKEIEAKVLASKLQAKKEDITNLALDISRKNEFAKVLGSKLDALQKEPLEVIKSKLTQIIHFTSSHLNLSESEELLQKNVSIVNSEFYSNLDSKYPDLTQNEKYLCGLLRLNISNKDISAIKGISVNSARMNRYRLRKKLGLASEIDIVRFLSDL